MQYNQNVCSTFSYGIREGCKIRKNLNIYKPTFNLINTSQLRHSKCAAIKIDEQSFGKTLISNFGDQNY